MFEALYYSFLLSLSIIVALCIVDERLAYFLYLQFQIVRIDIMKRWIMFTILRKTFIQDWLMRRRINKLVKELQEEIKKQEQ